MQNRWYHIPALHAPLQGKERKVSWLELFYDLIFVVAILELGTGLRRHNNVDGVILFAGLFVPLWSAWTNFTFYSNRFIVDDFAHRMLVFAQLFSVGAVAIYIPRVFAGAPVGFALSYAMLRLSSVLMYARTYRQTPESRPITGRYTVGAGVSTAIWLLSAGVAPPWTYLLWLVALGVDFGLPLSSRGQETYVRYPPDVMHMTERYGLLVLTILAVSFVKALVDLIDAGVTSSTLLMGTLSLPILFSLWWIYFDDVAGSRLRARRAAAVVWIYAHLPLTMALTGVDVGLELAVGFNPLQPEDAAVRWLLCGSLGLAFLAVGIIDAYTERRQSELSDRTRVDARIVSAFLILLLAPAGRLMPAWGFLGLVALACVAQVIFDLTMAPIAADPHAARQDAQRALDRANAVGRSARSGGSGSPPAAGNFRAPAGDRTASTSATAGPAARGRGARTGDADGPAMVLPSDSPEDHGGPAVALANDASVADAEGQVTALSSGSTMAQVAGGSDGQLAATVGSQPATAQLAGARGGPLATTTGGPLTAAPGGQPTAAQLAAMLRSGTGEASSRRSGPRPTADVSQAVRKGAPEELRRDLYFFLMEGSWWRLFGALMSGYLMINLVFASLYVLDEGSIANARPDSFLDAFFFSVQTMSTVGYGAMSPATTYGNVLMTTEVVVGMLSVALATGIMFAKASRPRSSVLFSNVAVITTLNGRPTLMFRVGNARGNEVVEASMRVTVLKEDTNPEGHRMRRLYDLHLERSTSPIFILTWTIMHVIDEKSPLFGIDPDHLEDHLLGMICTMTGFDGTYAQTTHARKTYLPAEIRYGHRFVDVISNLEDGRMMVDYERFHDTEPDPAG